MELGGKRQKRRGSLNNRVVLLILPWCFVGGGGFISQREGKQMNGASSAVWAERPWQQRLWQSGKGLCPRGRQQFWVVILALPWHHRIFSRLRSLEIILRAEGHSEPEAATEEGVRFPTVCPWARGFPRTKHFQCQNWERSGQNRMDWPHSTGWNDETGQKCHSSHINRLSKFFQNVSRAEKQTFLGKCGKLSLCATKMDRAPAPCRKQGCVYQQVFAHTPRAPKT